MSVFPAAFAFEEFDDFLSVLEELFEEPSDEKASSLLLEGLAEPQATNNAAIIDAKNMMMFFMFLPRLKYIA